jgi:hypothetical protein
MVRVAASQRRQRKVAARKGAVKFNFPAR